MSENNKNNGNSVHKLNVYVYKILPQKCPFCGDQLVPAKLKTKKGKLINLAMATCKRCKKRFATPVFFTTYEDNINLQNPETALPFIEERKTRLEEKKRRREEKEAKRLADKLAEKEALNKLRRGENTRVIEPRKDQPTKKSILEMINREWSSIPGFDIDEYAQSWTSLNLRQSVFASLFVLFLTRNNEGQYNCFAISSVYNEIKQNETTILHINGELAQTLLDSIKQQQTHFTYRGNRFDVVSAIAVKENTLFKYVGRTNLKKLYSPKNKLISQTSTKRQIEYSSRECVYVYFRLTNSCVKYKHEIETVTAKTINAKNGEPIEVNVFHCLDCDKYFINYEVLQEYISHGIFPAFTYSMVRSDNSNMKEASQLMLYGYNVRDGILSGYERQNVLAWIIDSKLMTKAEIIKDLQFKARYNGSKIGNEKAKAKWQDDILFVSQYVSDNTKTIQAEFFRGKNS